MGNNYYERRNLYTDDVIIAAYREYGSQTKAAAHLGISRETVARACRRNGIPLTGRKNNGGLNGGRPLKVTDVELMEDAKALSAQEIAYKYHMNECSVHERLTRLHILPAKGLGRGGNKWYKRALSFGSDSFDRSITLVSVYERDHGVCQICGRLTDKSARTERHVLGMYPSIDHIIPLSKGGGHTWDNVQLAHMACNAKKCDRLGVTM